MKNYMITQLDALEPVQCPCGWARRGFATPENSTATVHIVDIEADAQTHYHKRLTEIYVVLEGHGHMELDGERVPIGRFSSILIRPGCRHRAVGRMKIINIAIPAFDPADEWFD